MPQVKATTIPTEIGTSMCSRRVRNEPHAPRWNGAAHHSTDGVASARLSDRNSVRKSSVMPWKYPPYSAKANSMTLPAMAPATAIRISRERSSRRWRSRASTPRNGCGG